MPQDEISRMTDEVMCMVTEEGVDFHRAFARSAHKRRLYHGRDREHYNYLFTQVLKRFKMRNRHALKKALHGSRPWQHGKITRSALPRGISPHRLKPGIETEPPEISTTLFASQVIQLTLPF